jgi:hypothetical protein
MKINILRKNNLSFMNPENYSLFDVYTTEIYNEVKEFTTMKALFKEVKIIRPLNISKIKQIDLNPTIILCELKIENITSKINFIDRSLKNSKFLKIDKNDHFDIITNGINLYLRDIQILNEETIISNKIISWIKNGEENKIEVSKDNLNLENLFFTVVNKVRNFILFLI